MKRIFVIMVAIASVLSSCNNTEVDESFYARNYVREKSKSTHAFYIDNRLDKRLCFIISETPICLHPRHLYTSVESQRTAHYLTELSTECRINFHNEISVEPNTKMLVRFYDRCAWPDEEAFNAFYFQRVLDATDPRSLMNKEHVKVNGFMWEFIYDFGKIPSQEVWIGDYWNYEQIDTWTAEYTLVVDEAFIRKLYPSPYYDYYDFGF